MWTMDLKHGGRLYRDSMGPNTIKLPNQFLR